MTTIDFVPGREYLYQGHRIRVLRVVDLEHVAGEYAATGAVQQFPIAALRPVPPAGMPVPDVEDPEPPTDDLLLVSDKAWAKAQRRLEILRPVLAERRNAALVEEVAKAHDVSTGTVYRWLRAYDKQGTVLALVERPRSGGRGRTRLPPGIDQLIRQAIETHYLTPQKKSVAKVVLAVQQQCQQAGLTAPGVNTVRRRVQQLSEEEKLRTRWSKKMAREQFEPLRSSFPGADFPLAVVQLDHTLVDLILVDETHRQPVGRPHLTMAFDVYSRMVVGFYLSFDPPGAIGTGLCLAHAILPKEMWLVDKGIQSSWPCWGVPAVIHVDNAKEFRGLMLERACEKYDIRLEFRPVRTPHWAGHVERGFGTFMRETHTLPGTTFSNVQERKGYSAEQKAALTLREYEQWLTLYILDVYHKRFHEGIQQVPYERYQQGILGSPSQPGRGLPGRIYDELQVYIDFLPAEERTVQEYGVVIDHIYYYADVLKPYINSLEPGTGKRRLKRKFTFKRDPRDISRLYFLDPETHQYHRIPYRETSYPPISVWEYRQAWQLARSKGMAEANSTEIFAAYDKMHAVAVAAVAQTKQLNKSRNRVLHGVPSTTADAFFPPDGSAAGTVQSSRPAGLSAPLPDDEIAAAAVPNPCLLTPFDGLYDDASFAPEHR